MPLFASEEEYERCSHDASLVAEKADTFIKEVYNQLETVKAQADAAAITAEQTCSLLEQKYVSLSSDFAKLESQNSQLNSALQQRLSELAQVQAGKHQIHLKSIEKDGEMERLSTEVSELHKSKRQLIGLLEQKDLEISEKNAAVKSYLDKIVNLTDSAAIREARVNEIEAELARSHVSCTRLSQEKELIERHNIWLNDELTTKVDSLIELRKAHSELDADMSAKIVDLERKLNESLSSLKWNKDRVMEQEMKLTSLQEELSSSKDAAAANEERYSAEISTVTKLVELYKESSKEWSKKAGELEGVIKALETHLSQVENGYKERLEKEISARKEFEKEAVYLKEKLEKCEAEVENSRKASELNLLPLSTYTTETWVDSVEGNDMVSDNRTVVPSIPIGVSGTALAASLLRDGWSLAKMYAKYHEAVDAMRHEQLGRKQSQAILERVLYEIEEKAGVILDERVEHERLVEAYSIVNQKLQHSLSEQTNLERTIRELKADSRRCERDYSIAQKEIVDLQKQVTILLKECRDVQLRCGSVGHDYADYSTTFPVVELNADSDAEKVISERLLTFKDINGLVEQNVQLRSLVRSFSDQIENREMELKEKFEVELQKHTDEAAAKVNAVLARAEEQGQMIESLHTSVAMYKRLYEEEHKLHSPYPRTVEIALDDGREDLMRLFEGSQEATKKAQEEASEHVRCLEEDLGKLRSEMISLRLERDKLSLEANFAREKLDRFMKEFEHQRDETNAVISRNVEFSQLIIDYQRKLREGSESLRVAEELPRKLSMEVSVLKHEKEMLLNSEKRACDEVRSLSERVHRLQASLDTIQSAEEVCEEARRAERRKQEEYIRQIEKEWAEAKKELHEERDNVRRLTLDREETMKNAMRQVEEMGKELANALNAVAAAEAKAAVAEARYSDMEKKIKSPETKIVGNDSECGISSPSTNDAISDLCVAREEIEKLREETQVIKTHMLQYKSIAQVNETALKQMEFAHENFKIEADKMRMSLEAELLSAREQVKELERECSSKSKEASSSAAEREAALASALSEIDRLKQESSVKMSQIATMDIQISALKEDLEKEHQRWRDAQTNYERQVILQSETIQELTKTSQAMAALQYEASELHKLVDALKTENNELKARWDVDKSMLEESKNVAENKYNEINEQNKILHNRLEALHIKLAENDRDSAGISSGNSIQDPLLDTGLHNVVNYLRRSKEIAETEISLLKQEKLRLQSQLESALKASETTQASLHAERATSRAMLFTEEEFKSLQLQVREVNLLRESNMQLREENKYNFEECQKLREVAHKARMETEQLETSLRECQTEVEAWKKEIEMQKIEKEHLERRVDELLVSCKNIDVEDYGRMREDIKQMQTNLSEKVAQLEENKKLLSEKQVVISELEQDIAKSRIELNERERRINESLQVEVSLKYEVERQKKLVAQLKKKLENLSKEKEELSKENQVLSKQLEDYKQGRGAVGDALAEHAMKEKEKEKDTRIQILEKTVERQREELKKEKDDHKTEKAKRLKTERTIMDSIKSVNQERNKLVDGLEKHKQALKRLSEEFEKLKHAKTSLPEGTTVVQILSGTLLDDLSAAYFLAVENFERVAHLVSSELGAPLADISPAVDASSSGLAIGQSVPSQVPSIVPAIGSTTSLPSAKPTEEREKRSTLPKSNVEARKTGRKLVRPRIIKPEEPQGDTEMPEIEGSNNDGKSVSSHNLETRGSLTLLTHTTVRKRLASSTSSELQEESLVQRGTSSDVEAPVPKKSKGSDFPQDGAEGQTAAVLENLETLPAVEEPSDAIGDLPQGSNEEAIDAEKDDVETSGEQDEEPKVGGDNNQVELQSESNDVLEEILYKQNESEGVFDEGSKVLAEQDFQQSVVESGSEREEGELVLDVADVESGGNMSGMVVESQEIGENQPEAAALAPPPVSSPVGDEETLVAAAATAAATATVDFGETSSPQVLNDEGDTEEVNAEGADNLNDGNNHQEVAMEADQNPEAAAALETTTGVRTKTGTVEIGMSKQSSPSVSAETQEVKQVSPVGQSSSSTTINLQERAKQRSLLRQAGVISSSVGRGRGRAARGRGARGGRGQSSGGQAG
ncbi:Nuclear-pore anchor [Camellia lanceoleosa]|uniref:Nuclear-pore anchor n=1 Tax=Camellia lanceoleosa TaxID=1840588 RepID=A0ACC0H1V1_9ERIC|nr:Nuclear-pore anchor [Camellia lanceoleosa]